MQNSSDVLFRKGIKNFQEKDFVKAEKCFEKLKKNHPTNKDILKNLSLCYFHNNKFQKCEQIIKTMFDNGYKEKKLIEFLLLVLKKQDDAKKILEIISQEKNNIDEKYQLLEKFERNAIAMDNQEIENYRSNSLKKINEAIYANNIKLNIDNQFLDPPLFYYSYDKNDNLELSKKLNQLFKNSYTELSQVTKINTQKNKKIKIGFISEYFINHTITKLFKGLILNLDTSLFEIRIFYLDNGKGIDKEFYEREKKGELKNFKLPKLFNEKKNLILNENLDILFYPDIGLSTQLYYLTFLRLAKYQITSWGHPETTGNPNIDFFLSSKLLETNVNEAQNHYSEKLLLSDYLPMYYSRPKIEEIDDNELSENNIYSCPQTLFKLHPDFDDIIFEILNNDKNAKIFFIKGKEMSFEKKILERFEKKISNKIERIFFLDQMSRTEYINHCGRSSVLLDPLYFGAGNSFHESMFYGTQTVTMPTQYLRSRIVEGAYRQMKIDNPPIAKNKKQYVALAIEIANTKKEKMLEIKKNYAEQAKRNLFENKEALKDFQKILLKIVER